MHLSKMLVIEFFFVSTPILPLLPTPPIRVRGPVHLREPGSGRLDLPGGRRGGGDGAGGRVVAWLHRRPRRPLPLQLRATRGAGGGLMFVNMSITAGSIRVEAVWNHHRVFLFHPSISLLPLRRPDLQRKTKSLVSVRTATHTLWLSHAHTNTGHLLTFTCSALSCFVFGQQKSPRLWPTPSPPPPPLSLQSHISCV